MNALDVLCAQLTRDLFAIAKFLFMKLFSISSIEIIKSCEEFFGFELPSILLSKRIAKSESMYHNP